MPRGDGTGPVGGGGRGYGRGMGRRHGCGQGRDVRGGPQVGAGERAAKSAGLMVPTSGATTPRVALVDEEACTPCGACQAACPTEAIGLGETAVMVNAELCCGCGACVEVCPSEAIGLP